MTESPDVVVAATFLDPTEKLERLRGYTSQVPILCNTLTVSATTAQRAAKSASVVGMPILPNYFARQKSVEFSLPLGVTTVPAILTNLLTAVGKTVEQIADTIAGIFPRTLAMIINEAAFAVQEAVATPEDIDTAMKLGTNYPKGPLAWCDEIGAEAIVAILDALAREYGPERYRVATLLRRHAEAGMKWIT